MVTVDMSTARAQITKRQRRMRRAAQRRLQRQHKAHLREIRAAEAARQARQQAIATWNAEEDRLQRLRDTQQKPLVQQNLNGPIPQEKPRAVKFAELVQITEIPVCNADKLPKPVASPIGVSVCGTDDDSDTDTDDNSSNNGASPRITFSQLPEGAFPDDDDDPEFAPDDPFVQNVPARPLQRRRRRITAKRLDVPLEQIIPARRTSKSKLAHAPKRPRPETEQSSIPFSSRTSPLSPMHDRNEPSNPRANGEHLIKEMPSDQHNQSSFKHSRNDVSPPIRHKNKRKRLHSTENEGPQVNKLKTVKISSESTNKTDCTTAQFDEPVKGQRGQSAGTKSLRRHHVEIPALNDSTARTLLTSSSERTFHRGLSSVQNGQVIGALRNGEAASTSVVKVHSRQNGHKLIGLHDDELGAKQQAELRDGDDDKDLDNMFSDLVKQKADNRAYREKMSCQEKRVQEENRGELLGTQRNVKKFRKGPVRYTQDGLRIMTYEEIAADQPSGLNGDCPFDCSCCF